jgi:hypothetical protein
VLAAPVRSLSVEIVQIAPAPGGKKRLAHIANRAFDPAFLQHYQLRRIQPLSNNL